MISLKDKISKGNADDKLSVVYIQSIKLYLAYDKLFKN